MDYTPGLYSNMNFNIKAPILFFLALAAALVPELAFAQDFPFAPTAGDKSREWFIQGLFGGLDGGGGNDPLSEIIRVFNSAVLCIGGILLFYTLVGGTLRTAGEGKVLGKWDSVWLPVRTALGVAAILPGPSGYAVIQYVVIWLALQGIGIADVMSSRFISNAVGSSTNAYTFDAANIKPEIVSVVRQMVMNSACVASFDATINANADYTKDMFGIRRDTTMDQALEHLDSYLSSTGIHEFNSYRFGCGSIAFPSEKIGTDATQLQLIDINALNQLRSAMWTTHQAHKNAALANAASIGAQVAEHARLKTDELLVRKEVDAAIDRIATAWATAAVQTAESQSQDMVNRKLVARIQEDGWIMLGSWYMQIAMAQQTIGDAMTVLPEVAIPQSIIEGSRAHMDGTSTLDRWIGGAVRFLKNEKVNIGEASGLIMYAVRITDAGGDTAVSSPGSTSPKGIMSSIMRKATSAFTGIDVNGSDKNPVILASEIGNRLTVSVSVSITAMAVAAGIAGLGATIGTNIVLVLVSILSPLMIALLGAGLTLSYYIPMLPYILWLGAVFGWVILIVEAVIAAPLWAVTHLAPDGDGVVGRGGQGYMLVLSLTLRPGLMVFGFAAAVAVMNPMGQFLNETFMGTFFGSVSPGFVGILKMLAGAVIYATIMLMIINRVFSLIHQIPDGILRWIGGGDNVIGQEAREASGGAGKAIAASTAAAGAAGALSGGAQQIASGARQRSIEKSQALNAQAGTAAQKEGNEGDRAARGMSSASESADGLDPQSSNFEKQEGGAKQQADSAAMSSVSAIGRSAEATLANGRAMKKNDPNRPSPGDVAAAKSIASSIGKTGADKDPGAARNWLDSASSNPTIQNSKFGSQVGNSSGALASVDAKLASARGAFNSNKASEAKQGASDSVAGIHASASDTIERAGSATPGDPNAPTQAQSMDAANIKADIESSGALNSPEAAQSWLSEAQGKFGDSSMGSEISSAANRMNSVGGTVRGGPGNPPGLNES